LLEVPSSPALRTLKLRLRLPRGKHVARLLVDGRPYGRFDAETGTIDLSGCSGSVSIEARY
jgi:hypothetical protein